jgi:nicotinamide riboside transporter PnuC
MADLDWIPIFEWVATALSLVAFYFCIRKQAFCFLIFIVADTLWLTAAAMMGHFSLVAQQVLYLGMNVVGFWMWRRESGPADRPLQGPPWEEMMGDGPDGVELEEEALGLTSIK